MPTMDDDLRPAVLRLLEREPPPGPVMAESAFVTDSLAGHIERLGRGETPVTAEGLASLCLAYAHAYVHPERLGEAVTLEDATLLAGRFARRRGGCRSLAGQDALRRVLLHHGFALQMLFDIPKTVHLLDALLRREVAPGGGVFVGLDLGAGTGILLLGQYLLARRRGYEAPRLWGVEHLPQVAARADDLLSGLGIGRVAHGDATTSAIYNDVPQGDIACVTNETLPSIAHRLYKEPFTAISAALFAALSGRLERTVFMPEAVWASDRTRRTWLRLSPENAFAGEASPVPARLFYMRDVELAGERIPADQVGAPFQALISPVWAEALGRRW